MSTSPLPVTSSSDRASGAGPPERTSTSLPSSSSSSSYDLGKTWRILANCLILASQKAEAAAGKLALPPPTTTTPQQQQSPDDDDNNNNSNNDNNPVPIDKETDDYVVNYLKQRVKWGKLVAYMEAELEGRSQELESIQQYTRTMPKCSRPRKRQRLEEADHVGIPTVIPTTSLENNVPPLPLASDPLVEPTAAVELSSSSLGD